MIKRILKEGEKGMCKGCGCDTDIEEGCQEGLKRKYGRSIFIILFKRAQRVNLRILLLLKVVEG